MIWLNISSLALNNNYSLTQRIQNNHETLYVQLFTHVRNDCTLYMKRQLFPVLYVVLVMYKRHAHHMLRTMDVPRNVCVPL